MNFPPPEGIVSDPLHSLSKADLAQHLCECQRWIDALATSDDNIAERTMSNVPETLNGGRTV